MPRMSGYLAACAIFRNEARYLAEWVAFHRIVGVEHLFLYNNLSDDDYAEVLEPFVAEGSVTLIDWPVYPGQNQAYDNCVERTRGAWRWVAFIDLDEFLFSPRIRPVPELLAQFEHLPGVGIPWAQFGTSGHSTPPPGLVIENYTQRRVGRRNLRQFKSLVDPAAVRRVPGAALLSIRRSEVPWAGPAFCFLPRPAGEPLLQPIGGRVRGKGPVLGLVRQASKCRCLHGHEPGTCRP